MTIGDGVRLFIGMGLAAGFLVVSVALVALLGAAVDAMTDRWRWRHHYWPDYWKQPGSDNQT